MPKRLTAPILCLFVLGLLAACSNSSPTHPTTITQAEGKGGTHNCTGTTFKFLTHLVDPPTFGQVTSSEAPVNDNINAGGLPNCGGNPP